MYRKISFLLLPPHIRKILFIDENNNDGADADDEGEDIHNENDEGGKRRKNFCCKRI